MTEIKPRTKKRSRKTKKKPSIKRKGAVKKAAKKRPAKPSLSIFTKVGYFLGSLRSKYIYMFTLAFFVLVFTYVIYLDFQVRERFEGGLWAVPSKVYARSLQLKPQMHLNADAFEKELRLMAYEVVTSIPQRAGQFRRWGPSFELISRDFKSGVSVHQSKAIRLEIKDGRVAVLEHLFKPEKIESAHLDPAIIGSIYPKRNEDRQLLRLDDVPERLVKTLVAIEDRSFYDHFGINPLAILRALLTNIKAGETRQGGSTLTQQLVKNLFLSSERSYWRKLNEAIMAMLLEAHYDKKSILQAYINEVYLGQNKTASIHGFELGSQFYFNKSVDQLTTAQGALLIGLIKGPSYYNPRRNKQRALKRRNLVLEVMKEQGVISSLHFEKSKKQTLAVVKRVSNAGVKYPAFIDLIKRQLRVRFSTEVLKHEGLQIYTTLDPQVQMIAEKAVSTGLKNIQYRSQGVPLQTAVIISDVATAEVLALIGDRETAFQGFNRALDAKRQIGSLIKPVIYLAALNSQPQTSENFTLASVLSDTPLSIQSRNGDVWQPKNYDHDYRGDVIFHDALVYSYNVPSVRLGLKIGLGEIVNTLRNLGLHKDVPVYPSMLLGAFELTPFDIANIYQTIAADGHQQHLHAIRSVLSHEGEPLVYYADEKKYTISEDVMYLIKSALHNVTQEGTAKSLANSGLKLAGKTGTTDNLRDSWFAGFSEDKLGVVWVGNDDNLETGLTGSSGALRIWSGIFRQLEIDSLDLEVPDNIDFLWVDRKTGLRAGFGCQNTVKLPFLSHRKPEQYTQCD